MAKCMLARRYLLAAIAAAITFVTSAQADDKYPSKPVRMVVSFAAGGPTDIVARVMSAKMSELLGQQFVVENRTGAGGNTGAADIAKAPADGYHLLMATVSTHAINPHYYKKIPYDAAKDFAPVGQVGVTPILLGDASVASRERRQGRRRFGKSQSGQIHLRLVRRRLDPSSLRRAVQDHGGRARHHAHSLSRLVGADEGPDRRADFHGVRRNAERRPAGGERRDPRDRRRHDESACARMPNLPTMDEQGFKGYDCYTWNAILAPAGTPQPIVERLNGAVQTAMQDAVVIKRLQEVGVDPTPGRGPKETTAFMQAELAKWGPIVKAAGAQAD